MVGKRGIGTSLGTRPARRADALPGAQQVGVTLGGWPFPGSNELIKESFSKC